MKVVLLTFLFQIVFGTLPPGTVVPRDDSFPVEFTGSNTEMTTGGLHGAIWTYLVAQDFAPDLLYDTGIIINGISGKYVKGTLGFITVRWAVTNGQAFDKPTSNTDLKLKLGQKNYYACIIYFNTITESQRVIDAATHKNYDIENYKNNLIVIKIMNPFSHLKPFTINFGEFKNFRDFYVNASNPDISNNPLSYLDIASSAQTDYCNNATYSYDPSTQVCQGNYNGPCCCISEQNGIFTLRDNKTVLVAIYNLPVQNLTKPSDPSNDCYPTSLTLIIPESNNNEYLSKNFGVTP